MDFMRFSFYPDFSTVSKRGWGVFLTLASLIFCSCSATVPLGHAPWQDTVTTSISKVKGSPKEQALSLYREAWQTVQLDFYDATFNGQRWEQWRNRYDNLIEDVDDAQVAIESMLTSLNDDYTRFLPPREMSEQNMQIDAKLYGIGIQIIQRDKKLLVVSTLDDTPAQTAGLMPLDWITKINGESTAGMDVRDAADRIRGEEGTPVSLTFQRGKSTLTKEIRRARIQIKAVFTKPLEDKRIGYIRLNSFISETALSEMISAMKSLKDKQALILDLRGNYGGLLNNAVDIADLFLRDEAIVSIEGRYNRQNRTFYGRIGNETKKPLVVVIDGGSASASEILSGALKENGRAKLVGTRSFGKGLVQKITPLSNGAGLNITISRYLTPQGHDINHLGIQPDIKVALSDEQFDRGEDPQLDKAIEILQPTLTPVLARSKNRKA